jgi:tRNA (adenine57-N1/adenine58-N1)-methyltransferase catalytic subunit
MKRVLIRKPAVLEIDGRKKIMSDFEKHVVDSNNEFHTKHGKIAKDSLSKKSGSIILSGRTEFVLLDADFIDLYRKLKRNMQIIGLKDIGAIITSTGLNKNSKVIEAGVGSGALTCYLANFVKKVVSYDIDERSLATAKENIATFSFKNVSINKGNIYEPKQVKEKGFDVLILDVPEPWNAIDTIHKAVKIGGFVAVYVPHIMQVKEFVTSMPDSLLFEKTIELIEREWVIDENRTRPTTKDHAHTAFLTFVRRIG